VTVKTSKGWVSIERGRSRDWHVILGAFSASSRSLGRALRMVGMPLNDVRRIASRMRHPSAAERAPWLRA
jgi:hypothetical protein